MERCAILVRADRWRTSIDALQSPPRRAVVDTNAGLRVSITLDVDTGASRMRDLTVGPIAWHLLAVSGAQLINLLAGVLFALSNVYWVGQLGAEAQAAVTLAAIPIMLVLTLLPIVSVGMSILVSHAVGAKDQRRANRIFNEAFGVALLVTAAIAAIAWSLRESFADLLTADPRTAASIAAYYRWFVPSVVVQIPLLLTAAAYGASGHIRVATFAQTGTVLLNVGLAPVLIFGWFGCPALGVEGAGLASFIACAIFMLGLILYSLRGGSYLRLQPKDWFERPRELRGALRIGLPTGLEGGVVAAYMMVIALLMRPFEPAEMAGFGIGQRVMQAGLLPLMALSSAIGIVVGQNFGAGSGRRVRQAVRSGLPIALVVAPVLLLLFQAAPQWIVSHFSSDVDAIEAAVVFLRSVAFSLVPAAVAYVAFGVLAGMGNTRPALYGSMAYALLVVAPGWLASQFPGFDPVWLWRIMVAANVAQAAVALYFLQHAFGRRTAIHPILREGALEAAP
jgi:putative MATE family efflux protein